MKKKLEYKSCQTVADQMNNGIYFDEKQCPKHGISKHCSCLFSVGSICIECLKERRFFKHGESDVK